MSKASDVFREAIVSLDLARSERLDSATVRGWKADLDAACTAYVEELVAEEEAKRVEADDAALDAEALKLFNARNGTTEGACHAAWRDVARAARRMYGAGETKPVTPTTTEELDAVPVGRFVKDQRGDTWKKTEIGWSLRNNKFITSLGLTGLAPLTLVSAPEATA